MTFVDAVKTCFGKYVSFSDRARRPEFWKFVLFLFLASTLLAVVDGLVFGPSIKEGMKQTMSADGNMTAFNYRSVEYGNGPLVSIFRLATFLPALAVVWRRLHDTGRPGWYALIPLLVSFAMVLFMFTGIFGVSDQNHAFGQVASNHGFCLTAMTSWVSFKTWQINNGEFRYELC